MSKAAKSLDISNASEKVAESCKLRPDLYACFGSYRIFQDGQDFGLCAASMPGSPQFQRAMGFFG